MMKVRSPFSGALPHRKYENTDIEIILYSILSTLINPKEIVKQYCCLELEATYISHKFDFAIPSHKLLIEADGCKWHGCKKCYPYLKPRQRDAIINEAVKAAGWTIVRIWEHDLKRNSDLVRQLLSTMI